jgi:CelD/BcsL family acetyltransferase involved in cellulose biosynthesis
MEILKISKEKDFFTLKERWDELVIDTGFENIFLTWEWMYNWWKIFKVKKDELFILLGLKKKKILGIAPFYRKRGFLKSIHFLGTGIAASDFLFFIVKKENEITFLETIKRYLLARRNQWDLLFLEGVSVENGKLVRHLKARKWKVRTLQNYSCFYLPLYSPFEDFEQTIKRNLIRNIKRRRKRLTQIGVVQWKELIHFQDPDLFSLFEEMMLLYQKRWSSLQNGAQNKILNNRLFLKFMKNITEEFYKRQWLSINFLTINGRSIAASYNFKFNKKIFSYMLCFDPKYKTYGPGFICLWESLRFYINAGYKIFEFLRGDERYKLQWTDRNRKEQDILIIKMSLKGILFLFYTNLHGLLKYIFKKYFFQILIELRKRLKITSWVNK